MWVILWIWDLLRGNALIRYVVLFVVFLLLVGVILFFRWWFRGDVVREVNEVEANRVMRGVEGDVLGGEVNRVDGEVGNVGRRVERVGGEVNRLRRGGEVEVKVGNGNVRVRNGMSVEGVNRIRCEVYPEEAECRQR